MDNRLQGPRLRYVLAQPIGTVFLGHLGDDSPDAAQAGEVPERQSAEISRDYPNSPIAKAQRSKYVWVAAMNKTVHLSERCPWFGATQYTMNPDLMTPVRAYQNRRDNTCDVCGASCVEELYKFRCWKRREMLTDGESVRRLEPFITYASKCCAKGLLGIQSEASRMKEAASPNAVPLLNMRGRCDCMGCHDQRDRAWNRRRLLIFLQVRAALPRSLCDAGNPIVRHVAQLL